MHQIIRLMKAFQPQRTFDAPRAFSGVFKGGALGDAPPKNVLAPKCHLKRRLTGLRRILLGTDRPTVILFPAWNLSY